MASEPDYEQDQEVKHLSPKDFRDLGYLQEVNRRLLHPLGLALSVVEVHGEWELGPIFDFRDDVAGVIFDDGLMDIRKAEYVYSEANHRKVERLSELGFIVQPIPEDKGQLDA